MWEPKDIPCIELLTQRIPDPSSRLGVSSPILLTCFRPTPVIRIRFVAGELAGMQAKDIGKG